MPKERHFESLCSAIVKKQLQSSAYHLLDVLESLCWLGRMKWKIYWHELSTIGEGGEASIDIAQMQIEIGLGRLPCNKNSYSDLITYHLCARI